MSQEVIHLSTVQNLKSLLIVYTNKIFNFDKCEKTNEINNSKNVFK